jgi:hypothetical protein
MGTGSLATSTGDSLATRLPGRRPERPHGTTLTTTELGALRDGLRAEPADRLRGETD